MSKEKIIKRIQNSIEELKELSEDIKVSDGSDSLEIDIALAKANLVVQEFQLLKNKQNVVANHFAVEAQPLQPTQIEQPVFVDPQPEKIKDEVNKPVLEAKKAVEKAAEKVRNSTQEAQQEIEKEIAQAQESVLKSQAEVEEGIVQAQESVLKSQAEVEEGIVQTQEKIIEPIEGIQPEDNKGKDELETSEESDLDNEQESGDSPKMVGERFQVGKSLNDLIQGSGTIDEKIAHSPIQSLQSAIGINDRFLFIREIFDNDVDKYKITIAELDKLDDIKQAVDYLSANFKIKKTETSLKFVELIKRRFAK